MFTATVLWVMVGSLAGLATVGLVLRVLLGRRRLRRRFGPIYHEVVATQGGRRGRRSLRAASASFDRQLAELGGSRGRFPPPRRRVPTQRH